MTPDTRQLWVTRYNALPNDLRKVAKDAVQFAAMGLVMGTILLPIFTLTSVGVGAFIGILALLS